MCARVTEEEQEKWEHRYRIYLEEMKATSYLSDGRIVSMLWQNRKT